MITDDASLRSFYLSLPLLVSLRSLSVETTRSYFRGDLLVTELMALDVNSRSDS